MELDFEQQANNTLRMHCRITTTISAIDTLEKFCMETTKPKLYLVYNHTNCNDLNSLETVKAQEIAHTISPSKKLIILSSLVKKCIQNIVRIFLVCDLELLLAIWAIKRLWSQCNLVVP